VILEGQVVRPTLKSDAENVVKNIEGIGRVVNNIEVLPPSPMDDQIRRAVARFRGRCRSIMSPGSMTILLALLLEAPFRSW
jgi:hypothetical protein